MTCLRHLIYNTNNIIPCILITVFIINIKIIFVVKIKLLQEAAKRMNMSQPAYLLGHIDNPNRTRYVVDAEDNFELFEIVKYYGMYEPFTDSIIVNTGENAILVFSCKECNSSVIFDDPNDIVYLYWLAEDSPLTYAKLALKENGLQDYVDAMNEFN